MTRVMERTDSDIHSFVNWAISSDSRRLQPKQRNQFKTSDGKCGFEQDGLSLGAGNRR